MESLQGLVGESGVVAVLNDEDTTKLMLQDAQCKDSDSKQEVSAGVIRSTSSVLRQAIRMSEQNPTSLEAT